MSAAVSSDTLPGTAGSVFAAGQARPATGLRPRRADLVDTAFVVGLCLLGLIGFRTSFGGLVWLWAGGFGLALGLLLAWVTVATRQLAAVVVLLTALVAVLFAGPVLPDTAVAGLIPTPATVVALLEGGLRGWIRLLSVVPPVGSTYHLLAVPYLAALLVSVLALSLARRCPWPATALLPPALLMVLTVLFGTDEPAAPVLQGAAFAAVAVGWLAVQRSRQTRIVTPGRTSRRLVAGLGLLAVAAGGGWLVGPYLPGVADTDRYTLREDLTPPFDPKDYPSPLAAFRRYATKDKDTTLLGVSGLPIGSRVRIGTMDEYDGLVWSVAGGSGPSAGSSGWFEKVGESIPRSREERSTVRDDDKQRDATVQVQVKAFSGVWLPDAGSVGRITFTGPRAAQLQDSFRYNRATHTAAVPIGLAPGDGYTMDVLLPGVRPLTTLTGRGLVRITQPDNHNVPDEVTGYASDHLTDIEGALPRVLALQKLMQQGFYSDGKDGEAMSLPGHGASRMRTLYDQTLNLIGDDEQYAAGTALLLRSVGLPSRVVMGFKVSEEHPRELKGSDATAWVEVPVDGYGWVPVDVTPDENRKINDQTPRPKRVPHPQAQPQPPQPVVAPDPDVQADQNNRRPQRKPPLLDSRTMLILVVALSVLVPLALVGAAVGTILGIKGGRRKRRRIRGAPSTRFAGGWYQITDLARDLGTPVPPHATRKEGAYQLSERYDRPGVVALAERADAGVFAPGDPSDEQVNAFWEEIGRAETDLLGTQTWRQRWRAKLSLASLRRH